VQKGKGFRKYRTSYIQLGRQNGKSFLNGILGTYYSAFAGYNYGQIYLTATKADQAKIVYNEMVKFINADKDLAEFFKVKEYKSEIEALNTKSKIKALGRDTNSIDGFRPLLGVVDEYHMHKTNQMYKLLEGGIKKMPQALISVITTAGFNISAPCKILYDYCCNILKGISQNETQFIYIAQMDKEDDMWLPNNWLKANPMLEYDNIALENLKPVASSAKDMGGNDLRDFITKQLNIWFEYSDRQYMQIEKLKKCASDMTLEDMRGKECIGGIDLSSGGDLTSLALEFILEEKGQKKYYIYSHSFMPIKRVEEHVKTDKAPYDIWIKEGLITVTETGGGYKTDYKYIISKLKEWIETYDLKVKMICYDPHNADTFLQDLEEIGDILEVKQYCKTLNDATVDFKLEVESGNVIYNRKNSLLEWSFANAKTVDNSMGEIKIDKDFKEKRIDPCDAVIDAHYYAFKQEEVKLDTTKYLTDDYLTKLYGE
jgi:phage terminase large subunit-like protein